LRHTAGGQSEWGRGARSFISNPLVFLCRRGIHLRAEAVAYDEIDLSCIVFLFIFLVPLDFFVVCL
jgi:hypothetical protein